MKDTVESICISVCVAAVAIALILAVMHGCSSGDRRYYDAQAVCVGAGGSWIPSGWGRDACVMPRSKE